MPSPAEPRRARGRQAAEWGLRVVAFAALAAALVLALRPPPADAGTARHSGDGAGLAAALERWTATADVREVDVRLDTTPDAASRDWLRALGRAGVAVRWTAPLPPPAAVAVEAVPSPLPAAALRAGGASGMLVAEDDAGVLARASVGGGTALVPLGTTVGALRVGGEPAVRAVEAGGDALAPAAAATRLADSVLVRRVLVLGGAGWEGKFVVAALEEAGWEVDARFVVAPTAEVAQGMTRPDTARHAAVVVLDASAAPLAPAIARYVRAGGGAVLLPEALAAAPLAALAPARAGRALEGSVARLAGARAREGLPAVALVPRPGAVVLERRDGEPVVAARRVEAGRVLQLGYAESWRWRMAGAADAPAEHRTWWSGLVAAAAYAPVVPVVPVAGGDPWRPLDDAPAARLIATLGAPAAADDAGAAPAPAAPALPIWPLVAVAAAALLLEWTSRRLRGAR